jgi:enoyl-CoA hydratase/carnithine racemase
MPTLVTSREGRVGTITLSRPEVFNCLSLETIAALAEALRGFERDGDTRAVVIRAEGKHFCTGAALDEVLARHADAAAMDDFMVHGHALHAAMEASPLPILAAVHGLCLAGGLELVLACDIVIAARGAQFGDQHARFGLLPGWGSTQRLPRILGLRRAMDLMLSARWIGAEEAGHWGLVNRVVEDEALIPQAMEYAAMLATRSPAGIAAMKRLARKGLELPLAEGLRLETETVAPAFASADVVEGLAAFREKREPRFG